MPTLFPINHDLLADARSGWNEHHRLFWMVGASGSGKSTVCQALGEQLGWPVFDMDAHIYGDWHARFDPVRHPVNTAWSRAENGLAWLLSLSWAEFDQFNRAALAEYLDLLAQDLADPDPDTPLLVDGGVYHAALLAQAIPAQQILCLHVPDRSSLRLWTDDPARYTMRGFMDPLPDAEAAWHKFLDFDQGIADTLLAESRAAGIPQVVRGQDDPVAETVSQVARHLSHALRS